MAKDHFQTEKHADFIALQNQLTREKEEAEARLQPQDELLIQLRQETNILGLPQFNEDDEDDTLTFDYFMRVNKLIITFALRSIKIQIQDLREERREALENYEDELFQDLLLQQIHLEGKAMDAISIIVYADLNLRMRDIVKAKVKYLHDPALNSQFEQECK